MTTAAYHYERNSLQNSYPRKQPQVPAPTNGSDDASLCNSPTMKPLYPRLNMVSSLSPEISHPRKTGTRSGEALLIQFLSNGNDPPPFDYDHDSESKELSFVGSVRNTITSDDSVEVPRSAHDLLETTPQISGNNLPSIHAILPLDRLYTKPRGSCGNDTHLRAFHRASFAPSSTANGNSRFHPVGPMHNPPPMHQSQRGLRLTPEGSSCYQSSNGSSRSPSTGYGDSNVIDTSKPEQVVGISPTSTATMSIDGIAGRQIGAYVCTVPGCNASPFPTQYLLNSHIVVHSSNGNHYCPVDGCTHSQGGSGKGFKRKSSIDRHLLTHNPPKYICPFCKDSKFIRADNLQR
ncbi:hypothetical protein S7711_03852 [Stachybotrys chartarum IBT 7711]|uniref:C2H2-type domain-containing protein n=1 Tax=Stachybotrys chartarum (strain CBS 109288 / IBT 7711) TaxID=1280523 RepID=A0A084AHS3_STACB|nr:hypothetical protein S7711_03852 [Stachybotrys chartarum IBT 7711]